MDPTAAKLIGAGIAAIALGGAGIGIGTIFGNYLAGALRNPAGTHAPAFGPRGVKLGDRHVAGGEAARRLWTGTSGQDHNESKGG